MESFGEKVRALGVSRAGSQTSGSEEWSPWGSAGAPGVPSEICRLGPAGHERYPSETQEFSMREDTLQPGLGISPL